MLSKDTSKLVRILVTTLLALSLVACGGGGSSTASSNQGGEVSSPQGNTTGSASLSWLPPTTYTDGSALSSLAGHNVYVDSGSGYVKVASINSPGITTHLVENLTAGTYKIAVTAYDVDGVESAFSNEVTITISA